MVMEGTKEQLILAIQSLNRSATAEFLTQFPESDLREYLASLRGHVRQTGGQSAFGTPDKQVIGIR
jgi:hypothetical protein